MIFALLRGIHLAMVVAAQTGDPTKSIKQEKARA